MRRFLRPPIAFAALFVVAVLVTGCMGSTANKAGDSRASGPTVLTLADPEPGGLDVGRWVREVERRSDGTLRIDVRARWRNKERDYDRGTIEDVRAGRVDIAKIAARSWDEAGVTSFRALGAPLLIDSYPLERRVLASKLPARMLPALEKIDLVGLAVLPGTLRKPLGVTRILRTPKDFDGATIGLRPSRVATMTFRALGSGTVAYVPGDSAEVSRLDGAELGADVVNNNGYYRGARALTTNINLWPRVVTLVMNGRAFDALSTRQKEALRSAADAVEDPQISDLAELDREKTLLLCRKGLALVTATPADLARLAKAVRPVYAELERDPETRELIRQIGLMKRRLGTSHRRPVACHGGGAHARTAASPIDGVYHSTITRAELLRSPAYTEGDDNGSNYGSFTLRIANGRFEWTGSADGIPEGGRVIVDGKRHRLTLLPTHPIDVAGEEDVYSWSSYRGVLSFRKVTPGPPVLVVHSWRPA